MCPDITPPAGYSRTSLPRKLGIGPGSRLGLVDPPSALLDLLVPWPPGATVVTDGLDLDVALVFVTRRAQLATGHTAIAPRLAPAGALWFAWPKRGSGVETDLNGDVLRDVILPTGWVDTKVCAIDGTWSGLRFVRRRALRN